MTTKELLLSALVIIMDASLRRLERILRSCKLSGFILTGELASFLAKKHAYIINQQKFLESCKFENLIPKSLRFRLRLNTRKEERFAHTLQIKTLIHIIKDKKKKKKYIISPERKSL